MNPSPLNAPRAPSAHEAARAALAALEGGGAVAVVTLIEARPSDGAAGPSPNSRSSFARDEAMAGSANLTDSERDARTDASPEPPPRTAAPRPGARLLVDNDGAVVGSLGDAALDRRARELALAALAGAAPATETVEAGGLRCTLFVEAHRAPEELVVVGAGHIAVPLARVGAMLGFRVTVLDDREDFATETRFPEAARVVHMDFDDPFRGVEIGPRSYVILVTRAHKYDFDCLRRMLESGAAPRYVGMIGSRRRVRAAFEALLAAGVPRAALGRVHAPVGLDIGAETPEEIAVSIAAEMIRVRRTGAAADRAAASISGAERVLERLVPKGDS